MKEQDQTRKRVSEAYARAVTHKTGCCGGGKQDDQVFKAAGYTPIDLIDLPAEVVDNAFGCGNPVAFAGVSPGEVVLDLGSGAGIDLFLAAKKVGPTGRVIGVDMTDEMIEKAKANIALSGFDNVEVRKGIIEKLPVEDSSVDWVISNCVINLSPEKERVFAEIARVLKPGGRISISDIVVDDLPDWVRSNDALYSSCIAGAVSEQAYLEGLRAAGLQEVEVQDRLVYDACQLEAFAESDPESGSCCGGSVDGKAMSELARELAGKIVSARFYGKKP